MRTRLRLWHPIELIVLAILALLIATVALASDIEKKHKELFRPVVLVRTNSGSGSGTVVCSKQAKAGDYINLVLTADHVIDSACKVETRWDPFLGADVKKEVRSTVWVEFYVYKDLSRQVGTTVIESDIVARDPKKDVALLRLRSTTPVSDVAPLWPKDEIPKLQIFQPVYAVGAQLGHPPLATKGELQNLDIEIEGNKYLLITAPIIYGSSGGTVYIFSETRDRWEVVGVPARGSVSGGTQMVTHLGKAVAPWTIYDFLEAHCYQYIYSERSSEDCDKAREEKAKREKERLPRVIPEASNPWENP